MKKWSWAIDQNTLSSHGWEVSHLFHRETSPDWTRTFCPKLRLLGKRLICLSFNPPPVHQVRGQGKQFQLSPWRLSLVGDKAVKEATVKGSWTFWQPFYQTTSKQNGKDPPGQPFWAMENCTIAAFALRRERSSVPPCLPSLQILSLGRKAAGREGIVSWKSVLGGWGSKLLRTLIDPPH